MRKDPIATFKKVISKAKTISIVTHWSPDGDAMGSFTEPVNSYLEMIEKNANSLITEWQNK